MVGKAGCPGETKVGCAGHRVIGRKEKRRPKRATLARLARLKTENEARRASLPTGRSNLSNL